MAHTLVRNRNHAFQAQSGRCAYCNLPMWCSNPDAFASHYGFTPSQARYFQCTAEHLHARRDGGTDAQANIVVACRRCNLLRHARQRPLSPSAYKKFVRKRLQQKRWLDRSSFKVVDRMQARVTLAAP